MRYAARIGPNDFSLEVVRHGNGRYAVRLNGAERLVEKRGSRETVALTVDGRLMDATISREGRAANRRETRSYGVTIGTDQYAVEIGDPLRRSSATVDLRRDGRADVCSTMPGRVGAILVKVGEQVRAGQGLVVVEAMKMENEIPSPKDGRVVGIGVKAGDIVESGVVLLSVE